MSLPFAFAVFGTFFISVIFYIKSLFKQTSAIPQLHFKESALASHLLKRCRLMTRKFDPPWCVRNAHIQTIMPFLIPSANIEFDREYLQMKDRGVVALDWVTHVSIHKRKRCTVLLVLPGLTADAVSVSHLCSMAADKGYRPIVFNQRGFGNTVLTTSKLLRNGDPTDLRDVVKFIHGRYPKALVTIVGFGTGCELLLSYLGEFGSSANVCAGVCISACFERSKRFTKMTQGLYDVLFLSKLKLILYTHSISLSKYIDFTELLKCWTFKEFDHHVFHKFYNFTNIEEFWDIFHPLRDVDEIAVPLLFVNSLDDPFYSKCKIPYELCKYYPQFLMVVTNNGGHCGFRDALTDESWADRLALDYIDSVLEFTNQGHTIKYGKCAKRSTI
ncbi:protein ABHD15-like [Dreissena polymorpha]|uniref:Uncharacterized protein n=1 Tax=Dreissena polymorpha TaxID=45954 RepID=A0A9D4N7F4_DREPO|nr:protein ABHD15-like [Dreissena polymorpha]KAH3888619.1 hypothetical protein DPMN_012658 [Dreissena polymorpha]